MLRTGRSRKNKLFIVFLLFAFLSLLFIGCTASERSPEDADNAKIPANRGEKVLSVHFIDVGQGDCTLFVTPNGKTILIDAGEKSASDAIVNYIKGQGIRKIDVVIATHPHSDHIGGMEDVIRAFDIGQVYMPKVMHTTQTFENLLLALQEKGLKVKTAKAGVTIDIDPDVEAVMLAPHSEAYENLNDYSAVLKVTYGNNSFLVTGDAEATSEKEMLASGDDLSADVLKVAHHGSSTSTTDEFLDAVHPAHAVILLGKDNDYGHPHRETIEKLTKRGIPIYRTDELGNIVFASDGQEILLYHPSSQGKTASPIETIYIG
ncbi:MAG TPA: MBL fold metallo-hydrolase, partial [Clostridiales bacterium]|nr:MBL fold metallo-hydrolase [Clostridiales bacterium]